VNLLTYTGEMRMLAVTHLRYSDCDLLISQFVYLTEAKHVKIAAEQVHTCGWCRARAWHSCRCAFTTSHVTSSLPGSRHFRPRPPGPSRRRW